MTLARFRSRSQRRPDAAPVPGRRMRRLGVLIAATGVLAAALLYFLETHNAGPSLEELIPGTSRANSRLMGIYYGHAGKMMWEWREALARPEVQAILIVLVAAIAAAVCFRVAWLDADRVKHT
ncbi:MAG TPA: hypothetical protein VJN96_17200 [Vicinamibacterales bacterium]|nr:hypothetical protein [Vicinamibacterales bacterium]